MTHSSQSTNGHTVVARETIYKLYVPEQTCTADRLRPIRVVWKFVPVTQTYYRQKEVVEIFFFFFFFFFSSIDTHDSRQQCAPAGILSSFFLLSLKKMVSKQDTGMGLPSLYNMWYHRVFPGGQNSRRTCKHCKRAGHCQAVR